MTNISLAHANARLSEYVERASQGEAVQITRRGHVVARLSGAERVRKPIQLSEMEAVTADMPAPGATSGEWMRTMREGERY